MSAAAAAGPWAEVGDAQLRSDIEILASAGVIDNITMQWPLPWTSVLGRLNELDALNDAPDYVREAAARVAARGANEVSMHRPHASFSFDATNEPNVVRGFDSLGRQDIQSQATYEYLWNTTAIHLALGAQTVNRFDHQTLIPDDSYVAQRLDGVLIYAGYKSHWWGPGWISALSLSNNARPMPQVGISRVETSAFETPWLSWLGPWQAEFFVGVLDGPREARNTIYTGARFAFNPLPHLELGFSRTTQMCGSGHECKPIADYFNLLNDNQHINSTNDEATIDVRYSGTFAGWAYETYCQFMNEDIMPRCGLCRAGWRS